MMTTSLSDMTLTTDTRTATLAARLRAARVFAGLDQTALANELGVARQTLSNWERDVATVPAIAMIRWAEVTRVSVEWLSFGAGVRPEGFEPPTYCSVVNRGCVTCGHWAYEHDLGGGGTRICEEPGCACQSYIEPSALTLRSALGLAA